MENRRWYDKDPILSEALELLNECDTLGSVRGED